MKLEFVGDNLPCSITIRVNNKRKVLRKNKRICFNLKEYGDYTIVITSKESLFEKFFDIFRIFTRYCSNYYGIEWFECADCIKLEIMFKYNAISDEVFKIGYRKSFFRIETNAWYPSKFVGLESFDYKRKYIYDSWLYWNYLLRNFWGFYIFIMLFVFLPVNGKYSSATTEEIMTAESFNIRLTLAFLIALVFLIRGFVHGSKAINSLFKYYKIYSEKYNDCK